MIILARKILPVTAPVIDDGALLVSGKKIVDIGRRKDLLKKYPKETVVDLSPALVMPGLVNAHAHLELSYLKGKIGETDDFIDWITRLVDLRRANGLKGIREPMVAALRQAIASGTTCFGDISSTDTALPMFVKSGVRAVCFLEVLGLDPGHAERTFDNFIKRFRKLEDLPDRIVADISPHSAYSVSALLFDKIKRYSSSNEIIIAVHLSETSYESLYMQGKPSGMDAYMRKFGWDKFRPSIKGTSLQYLKEFGLHVRLLAVHAVHVTQKDINILKKSGSSVVQCPRSNHLLRAGRVPVEKFLQSGINVCIGTDSLASNIDLDLWEEMRFAYLVGRVSAEQVIRMATINGATALGLEDVTGSLTPGKDADLIAVESPAAGSTDPYRELLFGTRQGDISLAMVQGKAIYSKTGYICDGL